MGMIIKADVPMDKKAWTHTRITEDLGTPEEHDDEFWRYNQWGIERDSDGRYEAYAFVCGEPIKIKGNLRSFREAAEYIHGLGGDKKVAETPEEIVEMEDAHADHPEVVAPDEGAVAIVIELEAPVQAEPECVISPDGMESFRQMFEKGRRRVISKARGESFAKRTADVDTPGERGSGFVVEPVDEGFRSTRSPMTALGYTLDNLGYSFGPKRSYRKEGGGTTPSRAEAEKYGWGDAQGFIDYMVERGMSPFGEPGDRGSAAFFSMIRDRIPEVLTRHGLPQGSSVYDAFAARLLARDILQDQKDRYIRDMAAANPGTVDPRKLGESLDRALYMKDKPVWAGERAANTVLTAHEKDEMGFFQAHAREFAKYRSDNWNNVRKSLDRKGEWANPDDVEKVLRSQFKAKYYRDWVKDRMRRLHPEYHHDVNALARKLYIDASRQWYDHQAAIGRGEAVGPEPRWYAPNYGVDLSSEDPSDIAQQNEVVFNEGNQAYMDIWHAADRLYRGLPADGKDRFDRFDLGDLTAPGGQERKVTSVADANRMRMRELSDGYTNDTIRRALLEDALNSHSDPESDDYKATEAKLDEVRKRIRGYQNSLAGAEATAALEREDRERRASEVDRTRQRGVKERLQALDARNRYLDRQSKRDKWLKEIEDHFEAENLYAVPSMEGKPVMDEATAGAIAGLEGPTRKLRAAYEDLRKLKDAGAKPDSLEVQNLNMRIGKLRDNIKRTVAGLDGSGITLDEDGLPVIGDGTMADAKAWQSYYATKRNREEGPKRTFNNLIRFMNDNEDKGGLTDKFLGHLPDSLIDVVLAESAKRNNGVPQVYDSVDDIPEERRHNRHREAKEDEYRARPDFKEYAQNKKIQGMARTQIKREAKQAAVDGTQMEPVDVNQRLRDIRAGVTGKTPKTRIKRKFPIGGGRGDTTGTVPQGVADETPAIRNANRDSGRPVGGDVEVPEEGPKKPEKKRRRTEYKPMQVNYSVKDIHEGKGGTGRIEGQGNKGKDPTNSYTGDTSDLNEKDREIAEGAGENAMKEKSFKNSMSADSMGAMSLMDMMTMIAKKEGKIDGRPYGDSMSVFAYGQITNTMGDGRDVPIPEEIPEKGSEGTVEKL